MLLNQKTVAERFIYAQRAHKDYRAVVFTRAELLDIFSDFLDRLVHDYGNSRKQMIAYHVAPLVGLPYQDVVRRMPRGSRDSWQELIADIKASLKEAALKKAGYTDEEIEAAR